MTNSRERHIPLDGTHNVRDLGGYALPSGGITTWRAVLRGDGLSRMTADSMRQLVDLGVRTIVDLRGDHELLPEPNPFAGHGVVAYRNIPLFDQLGPIAAFDVPFDMAERYRNALDHCGPRIAEVIRAIAEAPAGAVLFHCTAGKDRTGIIAAMLLTIAGVPEQTVIEDYALTATLALPLLDRLRAAAIERGADPAHMARILASEARTIQSMLDHLDGQHGGIDSYLGRIGIEEQTLGLLARRLVG